MFAMSFHFCPTSSKLNSLTRNIGEDWKETGKDGKEDISKKEKPWR